MTIIGFLFGSLLYLTIEPSIYFIFLFGGVGYFIGVIFDSSDYRKQQENLHISSIRTTHEIFHPDELPEGVIIYSSLDNVTSVLLDFQVERKPENYRLSVLKNLQEYDFRVIEDSSKTLFSLCIEYPEFNYPAILNSDIRVKKFLFNIKERSGDFQGAIQKIIPGIILSKVTNPDIFGNSCNLIFQNQNFQYSFDPKDPQPDHTDSDMITLDKEAVPSEISESEILNDLIESTNITNQSTSKEKNDDDINADISGIFRRTKPEKTKNKTPKLRLLTGKEISERAEEPSPTIKIEAESDKKEVDINSEVARQLNSASINADYSDVNEIDFDEKISTCEDPKIINQLEKAIAEKQVEINENNKETDQENGYITNNLTEQKT
jgi:hypothetical protein